MHYEWLFWGMTEVVACAVVWGVAAACLVVRLALTLLGCVLGAGMVGGAVAWMTSSPIWSEAGAILVLASMMFFWVISSAVALLVFRLRRKSSLLSSDSGG